MRNASNLPPYAPGPAADQQRPLGRGSTQASLADGVSPFIRDLGFRRTSCFFGRPSAFETDSDETSSTVDASFHTSSSESDPFMAPETMKRRPARHGRRGETHSSRVRASSTVPASLLAHAQKAAIKRSKSIVYVRPFPQHVQQYDKAQRERIF